MAQTIVVPSGDRLEFPDGMADADIEKAIFAEYPDMAPKKGAMSRIGDAMKPAEREPMPSAADMINAPWTSSFVPQDETINLPGSVMDKFRQPAQKEQAMPIESGMGPMRKDFYDTTRSQIMAAPAQQHEALAVAEGQVGKVAAATLPERQARADRLAAGDMQPRSMQELSDQTEADLRQPRAMFDARQQANREWLQENSKAVAKSIQKNTGLSDEDADAEVERMARAGYKPDWLMDDMPTATLAQAISANTGATWPALQKSLLGLAEFAPNLPVPFVEYSRRTPKQLEMAVSSLDRQIRQARNVGGVIKSGSWNDVVASMGPSLALNLPPLVAGALASSVSPAAGMAIVNGGLGVMGLSAFGDAYLKGQQKGLQSGDNLMQASLSAAAEVIPEKLSLNALFAAFKTLGKGSAIETVKSFLKQQLTEHTTEQLTTVLHHLIDKAYTEPNKPIEQLWDEVKQTAMATAIQAPLLAGAGTGAYVAGRAGAKAIDNIAASRDLTYGREFDQDQIDAQVRQSLAPDAAQLRRTSPPPPPAAAPSARAELEAILNDKRPVEEILAENQNKAAEAAGWPAINTPVVAKLIDGQLIRGQIQRIDNGAARFIASDGEVYVFEPGEAEISATSGDGTRAAPVKAVTADDVKLAEQAVDTNPTESQKAAGNYQLGHLNLQGMDIAIENPAGSVRSGVGKDGKPWANTLNHTYGYIKSAEAKDGDKLDAFIGPNPESQAVFVIDQIDPETGRYDEAKAMLGFSSLDEARAAYLSNYDAGWQGLGDITPMHIQAFKAWIAKGDTRKPLAYDEKAAIAARKAEAEQIALLEQINQRFPEPAAPAQTAQSIPSSPQPVPEAAGLQPTGDTNAQAQEAIAAKPRQQEAPAAAVTNPPSTGESPVAQPVGATEKAVIRTKAGKLEVSGFSREDVDGSLTGAKIKAVIAQGQDGKILVSMVGRDGNHMPMPVKQANAVRDALLGKPARPARKRGLTGNLRNDVNIIAPGLYAEVARGGDGEGLAGLDMSLIAESLRDQGFMLPTTETGKDSDAVIELIRQDIANGGGTLNEARTTAAMTEAEQKAHRQEVLRLADEYGVPAKDKGIWRKSEDVLADVENAIKHELGLAGSAVVEITKSGVAAGAFTSAEAKTLALGVAEAYRGDQGRDAKVRMYREIANLLQDKINERESEQNREVGRGSGEGRGTQGEAEAERPALELAGQSAEEIRAEEARIAAAKEAEEAEAREAEAKARKEKAEKDKADVQNRLANQPFEFGVGAKEAKKPQQDIFAAAPSAQTVTAPPQGEASISRSRPKSTITFKRPIVGPSGAKVISYTWQWKPFDFIDASGEDRVGRMSDWDKAEENIETGRDVVHQFVIQDQFGDEKIVSLESAVGLLGFADGPGKARFKSVSSAAKTLARNQMQLAEAASAKEAFDRDLKEVEALPLPEVVRDESDPDKWYMGDTPIWQSQRLFPNGNSDSLLPERYRVLVDHWRDQRMFERGWKERRSPHSLNNRISDLTRRIAKAQARIDELVAQNSESQPADPVAESLAPAPLEPGDAGVTPIQGGAAAEREKDAKGNPIYKLGDRVEYISGGYEGRHGAISQVSPVTMRTIMVFGGGQGTSETAYYYHVKTDNGADFMASPEEIRFETEKPNSVVPDITVDGMIMEPRRVLDGIGYAKRSAENARAAAQRARKAESIADHKRTAERNDKKAAEYRAAWDAWAEKYPAEAEKIAPKPAEKPAVKPGNAETIRIAGGADALKAAGLVVTKTTTKNGKPVWEVSGNTKEHSDMLKRIGGRWYGPKKVWSFYNDDPSAAIAEKLGGTVKESLAVELAENEVMLPDVPYIYGKVGDQWHYKAVGATYQGYAGVVGGEMAIKLDAALERKNPKILGGPAIEAPAAVLERVADQETPAGEKARAELAEREEADKQDMDALFDEVLAEETMEVGAGETAKAPKARWESYEITPSLREGRFTVREARGDGSYQNLAEFGFSNGRVVKLQHFFESPSTRTPIEMAIDRWRNQQNQTPLTAGQALSSAAVNTGKGLIDAIDGLGKLFGSNGSRLSMGISFDEDTYAKAKPLFSQAVAHFKDAGQDLKEAMRAVVRMVLDKFGPQVTENMRPYIVRFMEDVRDGKIDYAGNKEADSNGSERDTDTAQGERDQGSRGTDVQPGAGQADQASLGGRPSGNVGAADESGASGRPGAGAPSGDVGVGEAIPEGGNAANGRPRAGGTGMADAGTGGRRGGKQSLGGTDGGDQSGERASEASGAAVNYHIADPEQLIGGTPKVRFARNRKAIEALQAIQSEGRQPAQDELDAMAGYIGWGSFGQELFQGTYDRPRPKDGWVKESDWLREHLGKEAWESAQASIINAHYTDPITVSTMWDMARQLGFTGGRVLEPSMGVGNFFGLMPRDLMARSRLAGIEMDKTTGAMAKLLYPEANVQIKPYQDSKTADNFYDLVIGNWPFAKDGPADRRYLKLSPSLHDFFFLKALDQTRPGGLVIGITSAGTMDKQGTLTRAALAEKADLVAAFRLPTGAFEKYAGTSVVTDIIILKKRETPNADVRGSGWLTTAEVDTPSGNPIKVNEYFAANPGNVLGTLNFGHGTTYGRAAMVVDRPADLEARMGALAKTLPEGVFEPATTRAKTIQYVTNNTKDRQQSIVAQDGKLFQVQGEYLAPLHEVKDYRVKDGKKTADREAQLVKLIDMRRKHGALIDAERDGLEDVETRRKALSDAYKAFTKAHGLLGESDGMAIMKLVGDPFHPPLAALEIDGKPAAILSRATVRSRKKLENPTVRDALIMMRNESVFVDMRRVAQMSGVTEAAAANELMDAGAVFLTPEGTYDVSDVYLSGNVRRKLREAEAAAESGMNMERNIEALKQVIPADVPYFNIEAKLGATWVPPEYYKQFIEHMLGTKSDGIEVRFVVNRWKVKFADRSLLSRSEAQTTWGSPWIHFNKLVDHAMGNMAVKVWGKDAEGNKVLNEQASAEANEKANKIREEFGNWLWADPVRKIEMERAYNEVMNAIAIPTFDGSFMAFEGMALQRGNSTFDMRSHQGNAVYRGLVNRRGIYAHEVGTGKTYTMGALAVESRRYGIAKKPLIFAHNANSSSVAREINEQYPGAKILYIDNLAPDRIDMTMRQIANDEWDAIVVPHSLINRFALKEETLMEISRHQIEALEQEAIEAANEDGVALTVDMMNDEDAIKKVRSVTAKQLVHGRNQIIKKVQEMALKSSKEGAVAFEDMGIDMIIVDEAHEFKKPPLATRMSMKGLNKTASNQSISLMFLTDYVKKLNGGTGVHVFTGTPITNTINEIYNMMRFVMDDQMSRDGVREWDAWFNTFADQTSDVELTPAGEYEPVSRLASFVNVPELRRMAGQYMDIVFADDMPEFSPRETKSGKTLASENLTDAERAELLNGRTEAPIGRPYKKIINDVAEMSPEQLVIFDELKRRAASFKAATKKERKEIMLSGDNRNPVIVETAAANAGLDARLYDIEGNDSPESKVNRVVKNVIAHYNEHDKATQVIFVDKGYTSESVSRKKDRQTGQVRVEKKPRFNLVRDIVAKLTEHGIPPNQIAIVDGSVSKDKRKEIADAMNESRIRVVIGQTDTLGVGVNMQVNLRAMHHMDAPWMPGELEQRNGRGHRQGNKWNTVLEYRYITERIDGRRWQVLSIKERFIKSFLKADDSVRVIEGDAVSLDEDGDLGNTLSDAAGDPRLLLMNKLRSDVQKLENRERMHAQGIFDAKREIGNLKDRIERVGKALANYRKDSEKFRAVAKDELVIEVGGRKFSDAEKANEAMELAASKVKVNADPIEIANIWGFTITAAQPVSWRGIEYHITGAAMHQMGKPTVESARATMYGVAKRAEGMEADIAEWTDSIPRMEEATKAPFARAKDLDKKRKMLADIEIDIQNNPVPAPAWLRNGTPAGTEVFVDGKPLTVEGHRYTNDGYYVTVSDGDGTRDIDYMEAKDENGLPKYEEHEFEAPKIIKSDKVHNSIEPLSDLSADRNAAITRAIDRAIAMEQGKDVAPLKRQRVRNRLGKLRADLEAGKITEPAFVAEVENLHAQMEIAYQSRQLEPRKGRERGADWIRQKLLEAKRRGDISEEAAKFAEWFVLKNPALVEDLGISLRSKQEGRASGNYNPANRVMTLFKGQASDTTAVHETLHHLERMMPADMQDAIRKEWLQQATKELNAAIKAKDQQRIAYFEAVLAGDQKNATEILTGGALDGLNSAVQDSAYGLPDQPSGNRTIDAATLRDLRRKAAGLEQPEKGKFLTVTADGLAITYGEPRTKIPESFARFAAKHGLTLEARRRLPGRTKEFYAGNSAPMPIEYRESGATYYGESGQYIDRTGRTRYSLDIGRDYRYLNPSEFWAVSMTETVADRFKAKDSIWSRSLQWLKEALEHIKSALGLNSTHPMIKALDAISNGDGEFVSKDMLSDAKLYASIEPISPVIEEVVGPVLRDASLPARLLLHPRQMAANHKEFAPVFDTAIRQYEERDSIVSKLGDFAKPYFDLSHAKKRRVGQIIEQGRLDRMTYTEADLENGIHHHGGDLVRLDAEEKAAYIALRKSFTHALTLFRNTMLEEYGFPELVNEERAAIRLAQMIAAGEIEESRLEWAKKVAVAIHEIEQANRTGYVPFTRYGQFVVAVKALPNGVDVVEDDDLVLVRGVPESADEGTADAKLVNIVADLMGQFDPERGAWIVPVSRNQAVRALENTLYATKVEVGSIKEWRSRGKDVTEIPEVKAVYEAAKARYGNVQNSRIIAFHVAEKEKARDANITAMDELAKIASVDTETWDEVRAKLQDAIKSRGFRRHFFGSDNTPGYSTDFERSIADYIIGMSGYLARRKHVKEFDDAIKRIKAPKLAAYADEYRQYVNSPADEFALVKQIGFLSYIAGTVATAFTNLTQVPMLTVPTLTQFVPNHIAVRETARAWKDAQAMFSPTKTGLQMFDPAKVPEDVREAFMAAWNDQLFVPLETLDLMATASVKTVGGRTTMRVLNTTTQAIAYQFMFAERLNRITTFVAAARISRMPVARQNAARVTAGDAWAKFSIGGRKWNERAFAEWAIDESQYRMGKVNRPKISRGVGSPLLQFKGYMMQTLEAGYRMAAMHGPRGQVSFLAALAMMLMLGGLWGLPGLEDLRDIIEKFYKLTTGKDLDMKTEVRRIVAETTGSATVGSAAAKGIPYATVGVDMSRVGMGNIIPDSPLQMLGIPADLAVGRPQRAAEKALAGNYYGAASELLPNFLKNPAVGFQWKFDGVRDRYGSRLMTPGEFDYADVAVKSLGWTPTKVTNRRDYAYAESRAESGINELKRRYTNDLVRAYVREQAAATDAERRQYQGEQKAVLDAIAKHNAKAGQEQIIKLDPDTLRKKVAAETLGGKAREGKERKLSRDAAQQRRELFQLP